MTKPLVAVFVTAVAAALPASAQTQPASPFLKETLPQRAAGEADREARPPASSSNFPTQLAATVPPARAEATRLTMLANRAQSEADAREETVLARETPAVIEAERRVAQAADDLREARAAATEGLSDDDAYVAAGTLADQIDRRIRDLHAAPYPDKAEIDRLAREALAYDAQQAAREREAYGASSAVAEASAALDEAQEALREARVALREAVKQDGELAMLRQQADDAAAEAMAARVYADQSGRAADLALDFARRETFGGYGYDRRYDHGYGYDRYGYGFGYGGFPFIGGFGGFVPVIGVVGRDDDGFNRRPAPVISNVVRGQSDFNGEPVISNVAR